jgi:hypothetical protein
VKVHLLLPVKKQFIYRLQANCNILYHTVLPITDRASEALEVHRWRSRTRRCVSYHLVHVSTLFLLPSVLQCTMTRTAHNTWLRTASLFTFAGIGRHQ